jgi:hypothetical protein
VHRHIRKILLRIQYHNIFLRNYTRGNYHANKICSQRKQISYQSTRFRNKTCTNKIQHVEYNLHDQPIARTNLVSNPHDGITQVSPFTFQIYQHTAQNLTHGGSKEKQSN